MVIDNWIVVGAIAAFALGYIVGQLNGRRQLALEYMEQQRLNEAKRQWQENIQNMMGGDDDEEE